MRYVLKPTRQLSDFTEGIITAVLNKHYGTETGTKMSVGKLRSEGNLLVFTDTCELMTKETC